MEKYIGYIPLMLLTLMLLIYFLKLGLKSGWKWISETSAFESHHLMTKKHTDVYGYGTYKDFIREFRKYEWYSKDEFINSLFTNNKNANTEIHAGIIKFNGIGMLLKTKKDYKKVMDWIDFYVNEDKEIYDWNSNQFLKNK